MIRAEAWRAACYPRAWTTLAASLPSAAQPLLLPVALDDGAATNPNTGNHLDILVHGKVQMIHNEECTCCHLRVPENTLRSLQYVRPTLKLIRAPLAIHKP